MVEKSRAKTVFDNFNGGIQSAIPDDLLNMVLARYNDLTASCQPTTTAPAADTTAPATTN
jgi:hypothetical protein